MISIKIDTGTTHDVTILKEQLLDFHKNTFSKKSTDFLENGAYDSKPLHNLIK